MSAWREIYEARWMSDPSVCMGWPQPDQRRKQKVEKSFMAAQKEISTNWGGSRKWQLGQIVPNK